MKNITDIIELSKKYLDGHKNMATRYGNWKDYSYPIVQNTLQKICKEIITKNDYFKSNLYVIDGSPAVGIYLKSGQTLVPSPDNLTETGFQIHFAPTYNGRIHVFVFEHSIANQGRHHSIELIDDPSTLTEEKVTDLVFIGIEKVYRTSHLFVGD